MATATRLVFLKFAFDNFCSHKYGNSTSHVSNQILKTLKINFKQPKQESQTNLITRISKLRKYQCNINV